MRKKQYLVLIIVLIIVVAALLAVIFGKRAQTRKAEEEAEAAIEYVNAFETGDVTAFSYDYYGETVSFELQDDLWICTADTTMEIDEEEVESFLSDISGMEADTVIEDVEDADQYGISEPSQILTVEFSDGSSLTYTFGIENDMVGGYYLQVSDDADGDGSGTVYLVDSTIVTSTLSREAESFQVEEESTESAE
ncbi:MAG: DUF4340 domain-containing protein [Clostridiales bacterium]|nr:DUF4340 domain-containing protein [Clostridiales bacterium]